MEQPVAHGGAQGERYECSSIHSICRLAQLHPIALTVFLSWRGMHCDAAEGDHPRSRRRASRAALYPHMPCTLPPGGVDDEHR